MGLSPITHPWGIQTSDNHGLSAISVFFWFKTEEELRTSIAAGGYDVDGEESDWEACREDVEAALAAIPKLAPESIVPLNASTNGGFRIDWLGQFEELCNGSSDSALWVRESFHEFKEDIPADITAPISSDETEDFAEHLKEVGI